jgi:integrase
MRMGRPRTARKDLPPGLYWTERRGFYFYRVRGGVTTYAGFGKVAREEAIAAWVKLTARPADPAKDGTVAELIDDFAAEELPRRERAKSIATATLEGYRRDLPTIRAEFGAKRFAKTAAEAMDPAVLRKADVARFLRKAENKPGAVAANRRVALLSAVFAWAIGEAFRTDVNPCSGVRRNEETVRDRRVTQADRDALAAAAPTPYRLMLRLTEATGMRLTDARLLRVQQVGEVIDLKQSKRGVEQRWEITPALRAIFDEAATLPGRGRSMYVFPKPDGTPYGEDGIAKQRQRALKAAGLTDLHHRDIRKAAVNEAKARGMNATDFAGHADERTTRKHYQTEPVKLKPLR